MRRHINENVLALGLLIAGLASARANLTTSYQFNGEGNWSLDGVGGNGSTVGQLQANVPVGATVERAFLYASMYDVSGTESLTAPSVTLAGQLYSGDAWTSLGSYQPNPASFPYFALGAYRADVTAQITSLVGGGSATLFNFDVSGESPNYGSVGVDGEVLAIVYSLPGEQTRTIAFLDGFSSSAGDSTTVNFASPLTGEQLAAPGFEAQFSLGIGFSTGDSQSSTVAIDVAGNQLTSSAGGYDDGSLVNGALITVGGIGDDPDNPVDPTSTDRLQDDELYTLNSFLSAGMTSFDILTRNPSLDDNIFFAGLNITAVAGVDQPAPSTGVPDSGSTLALLGAAVWLMALCHGSKGAEA